MKNKIKIVIIGTVLNVLTLNIFGQLRVDNVGNVGIGTTNPFGKLDVVGTAWIRGGGNEIRFTPNNPGTEIGSNYGSINFWHTATGWNDLYARAYYTTSDSTLKKNITTLQNCTSIIKKINGYKYQFIASQGDPQSRNSEKKEIYNYGILAQEIERVLPDLVAEAKGVKTVNYQGLIPVIIEAMKEQQKIIENSTKKIDSLSDVISQYNTEEQKIESLSNIVNQCCSKNQQLYNNSSNNASNTLPTDQKSKGKLYQNTPNPYSNETKIEYELNETTQSASIVVFDLQGNLKKSYPLTSKTNGSIIIKSGEFNQGIYIYSLIIDNQEIDSKRMILIE